MIFVTGGTGLLGSHLLVELLKDDTPVIASYRSEKKKNQCLKVFKYYFGEQAESKFNLISWVKCDILDIGDLLSHIPANSDVYHCAAIVSFHSKDFNRMIKVNREGTANVVNVCLQNKVRKLCYVSSTAAIGGGADKLITENTKWKKTETTTGYSISKYSAEKEVWRGIEEGLNAVMVNPCVILGAGNWSDSSLTVFKAVSAERRYYPPGSNSIVDARDVAEIMVRLMHSNISAERYLCIGSNQKIKLLIDEIADQLNIRKPTKEAPRWLVEFARKMIALVYLFRSGKPTVTKENVSSIFGHRKYDNSKVCETLDFKFRKLPEVVSNAVAGKIS